MQLCKVLIPFFRILRLGLGAYGAWLGALPQKLEQGFQAGKPVALTGVWAFE
jgi:hypothetical protein